jgi:hypothetical protein
MDYFKKMLSERKEQNEKYGYENYLILRTPSERYSGEAAGLPAYIGKNRRYKLKPDEFEFLRLDDAITLFDECESYKHDPAEPGIYKYELVMDYSYVTASETALIKPYAYDKKIFSPLDKKYAVIAKVAYLYYDDLRNGEYYLNDAERLEEINQIYEYNHRVIEAENVKIMTFPEALKIVDEFEIGTRKDIQTEGIAKENGKPEICYDVIRFFDGRKFRLSDKKNIV